MKKENRKPLPSQAICNSCLKVFSPSSRHKDCPQCRYRNKKHDCLDCGKKISQKHTRCIKCNNATRIGNSLPTEKRKATPNERGYLRYSDGSFEHRHIMELHLGRKLTRGENVHHKNGIRSDNRIENLELWLISQPSGQRAKDLVLWAREILSRYEHLIDKL